jgi:hypothetical protein
MGAGASTAEMSEAYLATHTSKLKKLMSYHDMTIQAMIEHYQACLAHLDWQAICPPLNVGGD